MLMLKSKLRLVGNLGCALKNTLASLLERYLIIILLQDSKEGPKALSSFCVISAVQQPLLISLVSLGRRFFQKGNK